MSRLWRTAISLWIALHLTLLLAWALPLDSGLRDRICRIARPYLLATGLWQGWDMFAPDPVAFNAYLDAEIVYADGSSELWEFPRMEKLGWVSAYLNERFRKWAIDNVRLDSSAALWPDTGRFVMSQLGHPHPPLAEIRLNRHWALIPPPGGAEPAWRSYTFYTYRPSQEGAP